MPNLSKSYPYFKRISKKKKALRAYLKRPGIMEGMDTTISPPALEAHELSRHFGRFQAVKSLNLTVPTGAFFGFLGPNGAGKSTTIKMLTGLLTPSAGSIRIFGENFHPQAVALKRKIGVVPEKLHLFEQLSAREYLHFSATMYGVAKSDIASRSEEILYFMRLEDKQHQALADYSHGMRKKIALAAALMHQPRLLFLDEPFEGLDVVSAKALQQLLKTLTQKGMTIFLTSHILDIVEKLCDHVAMIQQGELIASAPIETWLHKGSLESHFLEHMGQEPLHSPLSWLTDAS